MFRSITLEVTGDARMVCEGCEQRVERALKTLNGIDKVRARARNQRIEVLFDTSMLDPAAIAERIATAGYQTRIAGSTAAAD